MSKLTEEERRNITSIANDRRCEECLQEYDFLNEDGLCEPCDLERMREWEQERKELNREYMRDKGVF